MRQVTRNISKLSAQLLVGWFSVISVYGADKSVGLSDLQADWQSFSEVLVAEHDNPYFHTPKSVFLAKQQAFLSAAQTLDRNRQIVEFAKLVALVGDGHTWMPMHPIPFEGMPPGPQFRPIPVRFELFDDGLFIVGATDEYANLIGAEVIRLGGTTVDLAIERVLTMLPGDAVQFSRDFVPEWLMLAELLVALEIAPDSDEIKIQVRKGNAVSDATFHPLPSDYRFDWIRSMDDGPISGATPVVEKWVRGGKGVPMWRENFSSTFRRSELEGDIFYLQINEIRNADSVAFADAAAQLVQAVTTEKSAKGVVIDLRLCIGGDGSLIPDFMAEVERLTDVTSIAVLTSRKTHSAGVMLVSALEQKTNAIFIGQATADRPNHYGETNIFVLPRTNFPVIYASEYYQTSTSNDQRANREPDVTVPYLSMDYFNGHDRSLERAMSLLKGN